MSSYYVQIKLFKLKIYPTKFRAQANFPPPYTMVLAVLKITRLHKTKKKIDIKHYHFLYQNNMSESTETLIPKYSNLFHK